MTASLAPLRSAEIIAVGSELLGSTRVDTNSLLLADGLASLGITLRAKAVVGDRRGDLATIFRQALERVDLVLLTGGLGPTDDDLTRDVVAEVLGLPLDEQPAIVADIESRFSRRGLRMPAINRRQAMVPRGATVLDNPNGSAPGLLLHVGDRVVVLLPGPPREMKPMFERVAESALSARAGRERFYRATVLIAGRSESHVEEAIQPIYAPLATGVPPIETTILAAPGQIEVHLTARSDDAGLATQVLTSARERIVAAIGDDAFSLDGRSMEETVGSLLLGAGGTIAVAESCSGGLLLSRLTDIPGSSAYVRGGVVAYSNDIKTAFADVPAELIVEHGAVSEPVAAAMAEGIRARMHASIGVGITGIAGPGGGSEAKPVGTIAIAVAAPSGTTVKTVRFNGSRAQIKHYATQSALDMVRRRLGG
ncbi:MAG: competence/damage-inducible protein A [Vicinamibacterales bacterium]